MTLNQIEQSIDFLSYDELLHLLDKLIRSLKQKSSAKIISSPKILEQQIARMAADSDIKREIAEIDREFAATELDGLEKL